MTRRCDACDEPALSAIRVFSQSPGMAAQQSFLCYRHLDLIRQQNWSKGNRRFWLGPVPPLAARSITTQRTKAVRSSQKNRAIAEPKATPDRRQAGRAADGPNGRRGTANWNPVSWEPTKSLHGPDGISRRAPGGARPPAGLLGLSWEPKGPRRNPAGRFSAGAKRGEWKRT